MCTVTTPKVVSTGTALSLSNKNMLTTAQSIRGFTLIELMIVVGIVAIIAAVGVPAYTNQVNKAYRADAQSALMQLASAMERFRTVNNTYCGNGACPHSGGTPNDNFFEDQAPLEGGEKYYNLRITTPDGNRYTLEATPIGGTRMEDDFIFILEHTGAKSRRKGGATEDGWDI